jgi:hypothetical protein
MKDEKERITKKKRREEKKREEKRREMNLAEWTTVS